MFLLFSALWWVLSDFKQLSNPGLGLLSPSRGISWMTGMFPPSQTKSSKNTGLKNYLKLCCWFWEEQISYVLLSAQKFGNWTVWLSDLGSQHYWSLIGQTIIPFPVSGILLPVSLFSFFIPAKKKVHLIPAQPISFWTIPLLIFDCSRQSLVRHTYWTLIGQTIIPFLVSIFLLPVSLFSFLFQPYRKFI